MTRITIHPVTMRMLGLRHWQRCEASEVMAEGEMMPAETLKTAMDLPFEERDLLEKIMQAIQQPPGSYQLQMVSRQQTVVRLRDRRQLVFDSLDGPDDCQTVHLAGLSDMLRDPALKRPVWNKLKRWVALAQT